MGLKLKTPWPAPYQKFAVEAGPSRIDGEGAFAAEEIPPRLKIGEIRGERISVAEARSEGSAIVGGPSRA